MYGRIIINLEGADEMFQLFMHSFLIHLGLWLLLRPAARVLVSLKRVEIPR